MVDTNQLLSMRTYFESGDTQSTQFRKTQLNLLKQVVIEYAPQIQEALFKDLKKSPEESWVTETGFFLS